jgi:hypothetical protein
MAVALIMLALAVGSCRTPKGSSRAEDASHACRRYYEAQYAPRRDQAGVDEVDQMVRDYEQQARHLQHGQFDDLADALLDHERTYVRLVDATQHHDETSSRRLLEEIRTLEDTINRRCAEVGVAKPTARPT